MVLRGAQRWRDRRFGTALRENTGEIVRLVSFRGKILSLVPALGRISRFGTCESRARESRPGISSGCREPNRRSRQKSGNQTSISARATPPEEPNGLICQSCRHRRASLKYLCETRRGEGVCVTIARAFKGARRVRAHCSSEVTRRRQLSTGKATPCRPYGGIA